MTIGGTGSYGMTEREAKALVMLNDGGVTALDAFYNSSAVASYMINKWADAGRLRVTYPDGCLTIKIYKKYVMQAERSIRTWETIAGGGSGSGAGQRWRDD